MCDDLVPHHMLLAWSTLGMIRHILVRPCISLCAVAGCQLMQTAELVNICRTPHNHRAVILTVCVVWPARGMQQYVQLMLLPVSLKLLCWEIASILLWNKKRSFVLLGRKQQPESSQACLWLLG